MRKMVLALVIPAALLVAMPALAQVGKEPGKKADLAGKQSLTADAWLQKLNKELNLTQRQQALIKPILEKSIAETRSILQDNKLTREQKRQEAQLVRARTNTEVRKHLTPEQITKFDQMVSKWENKKDRKWTSGKGSCNNAKPKDKGT